MEVIVILLFIASVIFITYYIFKVVFMVFETIFYLIKFAYISRKLNKVETLISEYPNVFTELYGDIRNLYPLNNTKMTEILKIPKKYWKTKEIEISNRLICERNEKKQKQINALKAKEIIELYPKAVLMILGTTKNLSDEQNATICKYTTTQLSELNFKIKEKIRIAIEEIDNRYNSLILRFPYGVELIQKLRLCKHLEKDLYSDIEFAIIQSGHSIKNSKYRLVNILDSIYEKYENIYLRYNSCIQWQQRQIELSNKAQNLRHKEYGSWGICFYTTKVTGINKFGEGSDYKLMVCQLFIKSFCLSDNVPYIHLKHCLSTRLNLPSFIAGTRTFVDKVYDEILNFIFSLSTNISVIICDSELGENCKNIESEHFKYLTKKFLENQITYINFSNLYAARQLVSKTIVVIELITENSHLINICNHIYSLVENSSIVYISLLKQFDESELWKLHNNEEKRIKEELEKALKEKEEIERRVCEEEEKRRLEVIKVSERKKLEEDKRKEQEEKDRLYRISHTLKVNSADYKRYLTSNRIQYFYHFTDNRNLESILKMGGLFSWQYCEEHNIKITFPGGDSISRSLDIRHGLQDYVRVSFCKDHPMKWIIEQKGYDVVLLKVKIDVACLADTLFSDINATDNMHHHGGTLADLKRIDIPATQQNFVSKDSNIFKQHQAEVMVKTFIPLEYIEIPSTVFAHRIFNDELPF